MRAPTAIDLCCGTGGWTDALLAEDFRVIGIDIKRHPEYRGEFVQADVREVDTWKYTGAFVVFASPNCDEFSRHDQPWTRRKNPPAPDLSVIHACFSFAAKIGAPLILENVRGAQKWIGKAVGHIGPYYFWGTGVPALLPRDVIRRFKERQPSADRVHRARIPITIATYFAVLYAAWSKERLA